MADTRVDKYKQVVKTKFKNVTNVVSSDEIDEILSRDIESEEDLSQALVDLARIDQSLDVTKIQIRFLLGVVAANAGKMYGHGMIDRIAREHGLSATTLREARSFARALKLNPSRLKAWIAEQLREQNGRLFWADVQKYIKTDSDPKVLGPGAMVKRNIRQTEKLGQSLEKLNEAIADLPPEEREQYEDELQGAVAVTMNEVRQFHTNLDRIAELDTEFKASRSKDYLDFIRSFPCAITGEYPVVAHHAVGNKGTSGKSSDYGAVPLSPELHTDGTHSVHKMGKVSFQKHHNVSFRRLVMNYIHYYITGQWLDMDLGKPVQ